MAAKLHFAENPLALHLLLERFEGLIDIVVANENLHGRSCVVEAWPRALRFARDDEGAPRSAKARRNFRRRR